MRHAKSSWNNPGLKDFDRPLNKRGINDAPRMGQYLKTVQLAPGRIYCSPAARTRATLKLLTEQLDIDESVTRFYEDLYFKSSGAYMDALKGTGNNVSVAMTIGHNPMTEDVLHLLSDKPIIKPFKTAVIACLEAEIQSWDELEVGICSLKWMAGPKNI